MSLMKKAIGGSIHRIREFELEKVNLIDEFDILQIVGEGWFGKILLTEHRSTQTEMVLKALPKAYTGISDFFREFHYGLHLAAHRNIVTTYDVAFETAGFYVFSQEYAPLGDLTSNVTETGLGELHAKRVARQLAAAVHHIHSRELVHRDIKLDNVLVFRSDFSRIKLCDFGETRRVNSTVRRHNEWLPYSPPEVLQIETDVTYKARTSHDVWQFGIVLFVCLTGCLPWQKAALDDPRYTRYQTWHNATLNIAKKPKLFQLISSRAQRMFKRLLDPKAEKRAATVLEVNKYVEDRWLAKLGAEKAANGGADDRDELCPSMYSFHSSVEEKNQLLHTLTTYGIETTVDRSKKKDRIREWIESSAIIEEYEEEESDANEEVRFYEEEEEEEPATMKGRHFPETRPVAKPADEVKRRARRSSASSGRKRQTVRPTERKIPFAPQVAEERETIARFASFPNGDPNLAIMKNGTNAAADSARVNPVLSRHQDPTPELTRPRVTASNGRGINGSPVHTPHAPQEDSPATSSGAFHPYPGEFEGEGEASGTDFQDQDPVAVRTSDESLRAATRSPQIPFRKHRSQATASTSEPARRSQSGSAVPGMPGDRVLFPVTLAEKSSAAASAMRADGQSPGSLSTVRGERSPGAPSENRSAGGSTVVAPAERPAAPTHRSMSQVENQSGAMLTAVRPENQSVNVPPGTRNGKPPAGTMQPAPVNALTMPVASHLVMQSFNALQGINTVPSPGEPAPGSRSSSAIAPGRTATPPRSKRNLPPEDTFTYGKDAYEHYGIAQGAILRAEGGRQGSAGSGSRSVSN